ncbi:S-layer homology domain-containing protein [Solibacillus sp. FSL W7-1464]|uniref:S-layer homology domain-containing protein n=1 Tax=Solibacillus sp. FSL W7-1464 TaxID=2921706 RepID=UPI0030F6C519
MKVLQLVCLLIFTVSFITATPASAAEKTIDQYYMDDVSYEHGAYEQLERFLYANIIDGYEEPTVYEEDGEVYEYISILLKPENSITRAQFTQILVNAMNLTHGESKKEFSDVNSSAWYYDIVHIASSKGIITGKEDGTFKPDDKITRGQMATMIYRAFNGTVNFPEKGKSFNDVKPNSYAYEAIVKTAGAGIVNGYGEMFKPDDYATRSHAVLMIDRAMHLESGNAEDETSIIATVNRYIDKEFEFSSDMASENLEDMDALYRETTTGYYLAYSLDSQLLLEGADFSTGSSSSQKIGEYSSKLISLNKRFAAVKIDDLKVHIKMTDLEIDFNLEMTLDLSGTAYLKKTEDDLWKIYNLVYEEEGFDDMLTAAAAMEEQ